jgi:hypothetical protein
MLEGGASNAIEFFFRAVQFVMGSHVQMEQAWVGFVLPLWVAVTHHKFTCRST